MPKTQDDNGFTETNVLPRGRKSRQIPDSLWDVLADSAARLVGFSKTAAPDVIDQLRRDLGSAAVRAKYTVTVSTDKSDENKHTLTFSARTKDVEPAADSPDTDAAATP